MGLISCGDGDGVAWSVECGEGLVEQDWPARVGSGVARLEVGESIVRREGV